MGSLFPDGIIIIGPQTEKNRVKMTKGLQLTVVRKREAGEGTRSRGCEDQHVIAPLGRLLPQRSPQSGGQTDPQQP